MHPVDLEGRLRVLFDEYHSASWSISVDRAREMQPDNPANSCYSKAAGELARRRFVLHRNTDKPLHGATLMAADILVLLHLCDGKWERTTSQNPPTLNPAEIEAVQAHVRAGGGLLVVTEYENDKYGNNLNELTSAFGITITNETVSDRTSTASGNPTWVLADLTAGDGETGLLHLVHRACFYRAAACALEPPAVAATRTNDRSSPPCAVLVATTEYGHGRVAVVTDSDLFGDEYIGSYGHVQLWLNILHWLSVPSEYRSAERAGKASPTQSHHGWSEHWLRTKELVDELRQLQAPDGRIAETVDSRTKAEECVEKLITTVPSLSEGFPHQTAYFLAVRDDLETWRRDGFAKPDFSEALTLFEPQRNRQDGSRHAAIFPMYTPNASLDVRFEALIVETVWPDWLSRVQEANYRENDKFVPARLVDHTRGFDSECAVLFPETVSVAGRDENRFGAIFCDREASRYQRVVGRCCDILRMAKPPQLDAFLASSRAVLDAYVLWDLIHDTSHSRGELPFDPFMVRQRSPYWMYGLEELRVDLRSFLEAYELRTELALAEHVCYAVLFDRIFRFATTGERVRNYDALGGQLLFTALHHRDVLQWRDNVLTIDWARLPSAVRELYDELTAIYRAGQVMSKVSYWSAAHDFLCAYLTPNVGSQWVASKRSFTDESSPRTLVDLVHDDEFPLGSFHLSLRRKLAAVDS